MKKSLFLLSLVTLTFNSFSYELDPVVFSSKEGVLNSKSSSTQIIIQEEEISKGSSLNTNIASVQSLDIVELGTKGGNTSIFFRGLESRHTLVLIDGVKVNDPSNPNKSFNSALFSSHDIERIEILSGAQSLLYGADAIGGVINIITKKKTTSTSLGFSAGSSSKIQAQTGKEFGASSIFFNGFYEDSEGDNASINGNEKDGYALKSGNLKFSTKLGQIDSHFSARVHSHFNEYDSSTTTGVVTDIEGYYNQNTHQIYSLGFSKKSLSLNLNYNKHDRFSRETKNIYNYEGVSTSEEIIYTPSSQLLFLVGGEKEQIKYKTPYSNFSQKDSSIVYGATKYGFNISDIKADLGLRLDSHSVYKEFVTYSLGLNKSLSKTTALKLNYAKGFKSPSLDQLYASNYGNENLKPETSDTFNLSLEQFTDNKLILNLFYNRLYDYISYVGSQYSNQDGFISYGSELSYDHSFEKAIISSSLYLADYKRDGGKKIYRRPTQKLKLSGNYFFTERISVNADANFISERFDKAQSGDITLSAYEIYNIGMSLKLSSSTLKAGVSNLFDKEYTQVSGYATAGRKTYLGWDYSF